MLKRLHPVTGGIALITILAFWLSTLLVELFGSVDQIIRVKTAIPFGFLILVPALAATAGTGFRLGANWRGALIDAKRRRMPLIAANGILVLIPSALFLSSRAQGGSFDTAFYAVQGVELLAGAGNLALLGMNMRDGFGLRKRRAKASEPLTKG